jgi:CheY-like chemotaxis protein
MMVTPAEILGASILIVDDQESNVGLLEVLLRQAGYTHVASTLLPQEVCALHRRNRYDLILLDLHLQIQQDQVVVMLPVQCTYFCRLHGGRDLAVAGV